MKTFLSDFYFFVLFHSSVSHDSSVGIITTQWDGEARIWILAGVHPASCVLSVIWKFFPQRYSSWAWSWALTCAYCQDCEWVELHFCPPVCCHGVHIDRFVFLTMLSVAKIVWHWWIMEHWCTDNWRRNAEVLRE